MILFTNFAFLAAVLLTGAGRQWKTYYVTYTFVSLCNLLYNLLCQNHLTWSFHPELLINHKIADLLNTFVLLPSITILYLYYYPSRKLTKFFYYFGWVIGLTLLESIWFMYGRITYDRGWSILWSFGFYLVMFYVIKLHQTNLKKALLLSLGSVIFLILVFKIPLWD
ncbi:CBO0543 family protein [Paenibacillus rigui]|uniref:Uncharacterized protein n=1 Tax=Paenibacillus rigui TaxID=554312 RepID=A0A229UPX1_9BACL|nr:CBO0543 family protein [Paenibacillus rigui]OXM85597.1 hypothetical protein CF651_14520 [Paenibacillus rigui]